MPRPSSQSPGRPSPGRSQSKRRPPKALAGPLPGPGPEGQDPATSAPAWASPTRRRQEAVSPGPARHLPRGDPALTHVPPHKALVSPRPGRKTARGSQPRPCPPLARPRSGFWAKASAKARLPPWQFAPAKALSLLQHPLAP